MSLVNQRVGSYRLVRKICANQDYKIYLAVHVRSSKKRIIQLAKLEGKLNKKESRARLKQKAESICAMNSPYAIPILKFDYAEIKGNNYFYIRTPKFEATTLKAWLQQRYEREPLTQQCAREIMRQVREAVEVFHRAGIAHLNIGLSSFVIEIGEGAISPRVYLNDFLPAILYSESIREDERKRKKALTEDRNALDELEKLLNQEVEKADVEHTARLESPLQTLERRLLIVEAENEQLQRRLRELEAEKERINRELQEQKESDTKLLTGAILASTVTTGTDATPITSSGGSTSHRSGRGSWAVGGLLLIALVLAGTTFLLGGVLFSGRPAWAFFVSSSAKVTITQAAYGLTDNYIFAGATRSISKVKTQSITVPATNVVFITGKSATGTLTFHNTQNPCNVASVIPAGTVFTDAQGISVVTNLPAILGASCNAAAPAHALKIGLAGNIGVHAMKQIYHATIMVDNPAAFVGGQFDLSYTTVQQSDIDQAARSIEVRLKQETLNALHLQIRTNEQYVSSPLCKSKQTSDHQVNDAATQVTVTASFTCTAEVYNSQEILARANQMLNRRAQALFGPNYSLKGDVSAEITHIATDIKHRTLVTVVASGLWTYQLSGTRTDQLARLISGKDKQDARSVLSDQKGVQSVAINISNNENTLPYNAHSINIVYSTTLVPIEEGTTFPFIY